MVLHHVIFLSLVLWRTFKVLHKKMKNLSSSSQFSIVWKTLSMIQIGKGSRWNPRLFWRTIEESFFLRVYGIFALLRGAYNYGVYTSTYFQLFNVTKNSFVTEIRFPILSILIGIYLAVTSKRKKCIKKYLLKYGTWIKQWY